MHTFTHKALRGQRYLVLVFLFLFGLAIRSSADLYEEKAKLYGKEMFYCQKDSDCSWVPADCCGGGMAVSEPLSNTWRSFLKAKCSNQSCSMDFAPEKGSVAHCQKGQCRMVKEEDLLMEEVKASKHPVPSEVKSEPEPVVSESQAKLPPDNQPRITAVETPVVAAKPLDKKAQALRDKKIKEKLELQSKQNKSKKGKAEHKLTVKKESKAEKRARLIAEAQEKKAQAKAAIDEKKAHQQAMKEEKIAQAKAKKDEKINKIQEAKAAKIEQKNESKSAKLARVQQAKADKLAKAQETKEEKLAQIKQSKALKQAQSEARHQEALAKKAAAKPSVRKVGPRHDGPCVEILDRDKRESCFKNMLKANDITAEVCANLDRMESRHTAKCYSQLAERTKDLETCHKIADSDQRFACYHRELFSFVKDPAECSMLKAASPELVTKSYAYGMCITSAAMNMQKVEICDQIPATNKDLYQHWVDCTAAVAKKSGDTAMCEHITARKNPAGTTQKALEACREQAAR